jgi:hypothetical protein
VAEAVRPDWEARRSFYRGELAIRSLQAMRSTSRLVLEGEGGRFAAVLTFFATAEDAQLADERLVALRIDLEPALASFGEFRVLGDFGGVVLGAIRVDAPVVGAPALVGFGRREPPPPVPGQQTLFLSRLRGSEGTEAFVHVASSPPRDVWPDAAFLGRAHVAHVDRGEAMP